MRRTNYSIKTWKESIDVQFENSSLNLNATNFDISFLLIRNGKPIDIKKAEEYINVSFI